jgi:uncharacterized iron-regulated membrane protein
MANYSVTHTCGHTAEHNLVGPGKQRDSKIAWLRRQPCWACHKAAEKVARDAANVQASAANLAAGLPALIGSEKQIAWAESIRAKALASIRNVAKRLGEGKQEQADSLGIALEDLNARRAAISDAGQAARLQLETETSATWWIDNRDDVESHVWTAVDKAKRLMVADIAERRAAEKEAQEAARREAAAARQAEERAAHQARRVEEEAKARTFVVSDRPGAVEVKGENLVIRSRDGRTALGFIDGGDWAVYQIGATTNLSSGHPEMERIAREARAVWEASNG